MCRIISLNSTYSGLKKQNKAKKTLANNNKKEAPVSINIIGDSNDVIPSTSNVSPKKNNKRKRSNDDEDDEDYEIDENVCKI